MAPARRGNNQLPWIAGWALAALILIVGAGAAAFNQDFSEPDNAMRLVRIRDMLAGQGWFDSVQHRLGAADGELLLQRASQRGLVGGGGRWLSADAATDGWALAAPAAVPAPHRAAGQAAAVGALAALSARPGSARRRGSQNAANCAGLTDCSSRQ